MNHIYKSTKKQLFAYSLLFFILAKGLTLFSSLGRYINDKDILLSGSDFTQCIASVPKNISDSITLSTSAILRWDKIDGTVYTCKWRKTGTEDDWIDLIVYENHIRLSGLKKSTEYEFRVRSNCINESDPDLSLESEFSESYLFRTTEHDSYCVPKSNAENHYIENFKLGVIDNSSSFDKSGYQDFSGIEMGLISGVSYNFSIKTLPNINPTTRTQEIYIDLNQDNDFYDDGELVFKSKPGQNALVAESISLPDHYKEGKTRMRVITRVLDDSAHSPCDVELGESEDYTVNLIKRITLNSLYPNPNEAEEGDYLVFNAGLDTIAKEDIVIKVNVEHISTTLEDFVNEIEYSLDSGESWNKSDEDTNSFIFPEGYKELKFRLATIEDNQFEPNDSLRITLTSEVAYLTIEQESVLGIIENDDDPPIISLKSNPEANEGDLITVTATLNHPSDLEVVINQVTLTPISADTLDYDENSITLPIIFEPGDTVKTFSIQTIEDRLVEDDETFTIELSDVSNATIDSTTVTTATILNDNLPPPILSLKPNPKANEGDLITVTATLNHPSDLEVVINQVTLTPISADTLDYDENSITLPIIFEPGDTVKTFAIQTIENIISEGDEEFEIAISDVSNATIGSGTVTATIIDDDIHILPLPVISLKASPKAIEGELMTVTATLNRQYHVQVTINEVTLTPKSADDSDYDENSITLPIIFEPGDTVKTFAIQTIENIISEGDEEFEIAISDVSNATIGSGTVTATIIDDDIHILPLPVISLKASPKAIEGELMTVTATLNRQYHVQVTINEVTLTPKSADDSDYDENSITLPIIFEPGETVKTFAIQTIEDRLVEDDETFTIELSDVSNATIRSGMATATIIDNDLKESKCVRIYPNPFSYYIYIEIPRRTHGHKPGPTKTSIYNESGKVVYKHSFPEHETKIRIHSHKIQCLPLGVYFLQISTSEWTSTHKIIKE